MARTAITPQQVSAEGLTIAYEPANVDGNSIASASTRRNLIVKNGSASSVNVTIPTPGTVGGLAIADRVIAVAAGAEVHIRTDSSSYRQSDGSAHIDYSAVTSVTVAVTQ